MYAKHHQLSLEFEIVRWMAIITLAGILALAVASTAWGSDVPPRTQPRGLPAAAELAPPMSALRADATAPVKAMTNGDRAPRTTPVIWEDFGKALFNLR